MQRKKVSHRAHTKHQDKSMLDGVKKTTEKAFEATREGVGNAVEGVKKVFD